MWEVPLWTLSALGLFSMDLGDANRSAYAVLKANFDAAYNGNRAPLPIYVHTPWFTPANVADMKRFAGAWVGLQCAGCLAGTAGAEVQAPVERHGRMWFA